VFAGYFKQLFKTSGRPAGVSHFRIISLSLSIVLRLGLILVLSIS
jgi:hypothetical protein